MHTRLRWLLALAGSLSLLSGCDGNCRRQDPKENSFVPPSITLRESGDLKVLVEQSLTFTDSRRIDWVAPVGTLTDGASVPRLALPITDGRWDSTFLKAAVVHDAYCQEENASGPQFHKKSWREVHRMFYDASLAGGTPPLTAKLMFAAVWLGGPRWGDPPAESRQASGEDLTIGLDGASAWIKEKDPAIGDIQADLEDREVVLKGLSGHEAGVALALQAGDMATAEVRLQAEQAYLAEAFGRRPNDTMLLTFQGNLHKNRAVLFRRRNLEVQALQQLTLSQETFDAVIERDPENPVAKKRLSGITELREGLIHSQPIVQPAAPLRPVDPAVRPDMRRLPRATDPR